MIRKYSDKDYSNCVTIINEVWRFDVIFKPKELSELFKKIYVLDSLSLSNFAIVIEEDNKVQGFLFGNCGYKNLIKNNYSGFAGKIKLIMELLSVKDVSLKKKMNYMKISQIHEKNRNKIEPSHENEINLFAVHPDVQGKGFGKELIWNFINHCQSQNATRVTLETDKECNYKFYNHIGFKMKGEFFSPLQKEYSGSSGDSFVFELKL
ncbi:MAG: GNAT family N-acetyltransferase [Spirochaetales bacterium]|nr:GNAT family N-acetyltransferase [Spirochaetales bacterium]